MSQRKQVDVLGATGFERLDGQHALGMSGHGDRRRTQKVQALPIQCPDRRDLGQQDAGQRHRGRGQMTRGWHRLVSGQLADPPQRLEADGPYHHEFVGDRFQQQFCFTHERGEFRLNTGRGDEFFEIGQPGTAALPAENHGIRLTGVESVHERLQAGAIGIIGAQPVVLMDGHRCTSPSIGCRRSLLGPPTALRFS